jgi:hypothetical protein
MVIQIKRLGGLGLGLGDDDGGGGDGGRRQRVSVKDARAALTTAESEKLIGNEESGEIGTLESATV